jgi:hypothetical protein
MATSEHIKTKAGKTGFSVARILRATLPDRIDKSAYVKLTSVKTGVSKSSGKRKIIAQAVSIDKKSPDRVKYNASLEFHGDDRVKLSCSCSDFLFRWEYALTQKGGADIVYGDGDPPDDKNPSQKPGCCKHLVALIFVAQERGLL